MTTAVDTEDQRPIITKETFQQFIGPNAEKYTELWEKQRNGKLATGFFLIGFLAPLPWLMYRKLYGYAAAVLLVPIAIAILFPDFSFQGTSAVAVALSFVLKYAYIAHAESKIRKILVRTSPGPERDAQLNKAGGVSLIAGTIGGVIYAAQIAMLLLSTPLHSQ